MQSFYSTDEIRKRIQGRPLYEEFLRVPAMSCGIYVLQPGELDLQQPHNEDEIYFVISGSARMRLIGDQPTEDRPIKAGDIIFVKALHEHKFHDVKQELVLLVVFAPART